MIEIFIGILLIVLATTFSNLEVVIAAMYLMLSQAHLISNAMYFVLAIIVTFFFPSAGLFSLVSMSYAYINRVSTIGCALLFAGCFIIGVLLNKLLGCKKLELYSSRRFLKMHGAMHIVYAFILIACAMTMFEIGMGVSQYSTIIVFMISIILFFKFDNVPINAKGIGINNNNKLN